jgi:hypothetical protein
MLVYFIFSHVMRVASAQGMASPQFADGGDRLQVWSLTHEDATKAHTYAC